MIPSSRRLFLLLFALLFIVCFFFLFEIPSLSKTTRPTCDQIHYNVSAKPVNVNVINLQVTQFEDQSDLRLLVVCPLAENYTTTTFHLKRQIAHLESFFQHRIGMKAHLIFEEIELHFFLNQKEQVTQSKEFLNILAALERLEKSIIVLNETTEETLVRWSAGFNPSQPFTHRLLSINAKQASKQKILVTMRSPFLLNTEQLSLLLTHFFPKISDPWHSHLRFPLTNFFRTNVSERLFQDLGFPPRLTKRYV